MSQASPKKGAKAVAALRSIHNEHLAKLQAKHQQECELLEDLRNFTKQRSAIEKTYAEALLKLSTSFLQKRIPHISEIKSDDGRERKTVYTLWRTLLDENEKLSKARLAAAEVYHQQISESAKTVKANKVHVAKKCFEHLQKIHEEVQVSVRDLDKVKKVYFDEEHFAHEARDKAHDAEEKLKRKKGNFFQSISSLQKNSAKFSSKREACDIKSTSARNDYILQLAATNAHQDRYYDVDLPEVIKTLDSEAYERVTEYIQLLSRTELLTCAATQSSYNKIIEMAELNTRKYNLECFMSEYPVLKEIIKYQFEPCDNDKLDFVSSEHNATHNLNKEARKCASRVNKDNKIIREYTKQLKSLLAQTTPGQRHDSTSDQASLDIEQKIDEMRQSIRKSETSKILAEARLHLLRKAGVNVDEWLKSTDIETLGPFDASGGGLSRSGSTLSIKTDISGNVEDGSSEVANDSFYDSDFNDTSSDISGGIATGAQGTPDQTRKTSTTDSQQDFPITAMTNGGDAFEQTDNLSETTSGTFIPLRAIALYNYEAQNPDELTMLENEQIEIIGEGDGDGWVKARNYQGEEGYIPQNYVEIEGGQAVPSSIEPAPVSFSSVDYHVPTSQAPAPTLSLNLTTTTTTLTTTTTETTTEVKERFCRALYDYEATCPEELTFFENQVIRILRKEVSDVDDGWWEGELEGRVGLFPSLVVEELDGSSQGSPDSLMSPPGSAPPTFTPPPMPSYLLPPAQVIITQPTPVGENPSEEQKEAAAGTSQSISYDSKGFEMELSEAHQVQYHTQFSSSDSELNEHGVLQQGEEGSGYSQLVSSPESPKSSPVHAAPQLPPAKDGGDINTAPNKEAPGADDDRGPIASPPTEEKMHPSQPPPEIQIFESGPQIVDEDYIVEPPPPLPADSEKQSGNAADIDVVSVEDNLSQTDAGSTPSNATGDGSSIDTVVEATAALVDTPDGIDEPVPLKDDKRTGVEVEGVKIDLKDYEDDEVDLK